MEQTGFVHSNLPEFGSSEKGFARLNFSDEGESGIIFTGIKGELFRNVKGKRVIRSCNFLGAFYSPLLYLDRKFFHKTIRYFEDRVSLITPVRVDPFSRLGHDALECSLN